MFDGTSIAAEIRLAKPRKLSILLGLTNFLTYAEPIRADILFGGGIWRALRPRRRRPNLICGGVAQRRICVVWGWGSDKNECGPGG